MREIECPHCNHIFDNSFEIDRETTNERIDTECESCGKSFDFMREFYPAYYTRK